MGKSRVNSTVPNTFKNLLINGNFTVWQRGTGPFTSAYVMTIDQWRTGSYGPVATGSYQLDGVVRGTWGNDVKLQVTRSTGAGYPTDTYYGYLNNRIEDVTQLEPGGIITVTCEVDTDESVNMWGQMQYGTGGSANEGLANAYGTSNYEIYPSDRKGYYIHTRSFAVPDWTTKTFGSTETKLYIEFDFYHLGANSTTETYHISNCQVENGNQFTGFELRDPILETLLCQRYFWRDYTEHAGAGYASAAGQIRAFCQIQYPARMRAVPTITTSGATFAYNNMSAMGLSVGSVDGTVLRGGSSVAAGLCLWRITAGYIDYSAEF